MSYDRHKFSESLRTPCCTVHRQQRGLTSKKLTTVRLFGHFSQITSLPEAFTQYQNLSLYVLMREYGRMCPESRDPKAGTFLGAN